MAVKKGLENLYISPQTNGFTLVYFENHYDLWFNDEIIKTFENEKKPTKQLVNKLDGGSAKFLHNKKDEKYYPKVITETYDAIIDNAERGINSFLTLKDLFHNLIIKKNKNENLKNSSDKIRNSYIKFNMEEKTTTRISQAIEQLIKDNYIDTINKINNGQTKDICIDCDILKHYSVEYKQSDEKETLYYHLLNRPQVFIEWFKLELTKLLNENIDEYYIRFDYHDKETPIKELLSHNIGKFIKTTGVVKGVYKITFPLKIATFECMGCQKLHYEEQDINRMNIIEPSLCNCGSRSFRLLNEESTYYNQRKILIEEPIEDLENRTNPRNMIVNIIGDNDFMHIVNPGDRVNITGIFETYRDEKSGDFNGFIDGKNIEKIGDTKISISDDEEKEILKLSQKPNILNELIKSTAPDLILDKELKLGVLCAIVGGGKVSHGRNLIHILIVSDPGTAKSDLFEWIDMSVEKCIMTSGTSSSGVGLTGAIDKDIITGQNILKAGALPLASNGICIGDELDKLPRNEMKKLNQMLEKGKENFNKGGINETLYANTTFIGGANPKYERFDEYKSLKEQINFPPSYISRNDLIYVIEDKPSVKDEKIVDKILNRYSNDENENNNDNDIIDHELLRKYLYYAKHEFNPILTIEAHEKAKEYSLSLRSKMLDHEIRDIVNFDFRDVGSIARLGGAIAKLHLRNEILPSDIEEVIKLKNHCLKGIGYDFENDIINVELLGGKVSTSKREQYQTIIEIINNEKSNDEESLYVNGYGVSKQIIKIKFTEMTGLSESTCNKVLQELYDNNKLSKISKGRNTYYDIKKI